MHCGTELNADLNASINIRNRVQSDVLRESLLTEVYPGVYKLKNFKKDKIRLILEDIVVQSGNYIPGLT